MFYWHKNSWYLGDGLKSGIDEEAPDVVQRIAMEAGITTSIADGKIDPDSIIFDIKVDLDYSGQVNSGSYDSPPSNETYVDGANSLVSIQIWNDKNKETEKQYYLSQEVESELFEAYGEEFADYAADKYAADGKPTYDNSDYED